MENDTDINNIEVWVDEDKISFVGVPDNNKLKSASFDREIDLDGNLLMPSFKNAHTHSAMTFLRSFCRRYAFAGLAFQTGISYGSQS